MISIIPKGSKRHRLLSLEKELKQICLALRRARQEPMGYNKIVHKYNMQSIDQLAKEVEESKHALWFVRASSKGVNLFPIVWKISFADCFYATGKQKERPKISAKTKREDRENYKKYIIHDFSCPSWFIPEHIRPILQTDWMRFLFKQTKRFVLTSIEQGGHDNSDVSPAECMWDLYHLHEYSSRESIIEELDRILYHASEIHELGHGCSYTHMIEFHMEDIISFSQNINVQVLCDEEEIICLPSTNIIHEDNMIHVVNIVHNFCSCRDHIQRGTCKHITGIFGNN